MDIIAMIAEARSRGASDLHITVANQPVLRINGVLGPLENSALLTKEDMESALEQVTNPREREEFFKELELDFGFTANDTRVRCNAAVHRGNIVLSMRLIPVRIPSLEGFIYPRCARTLLLNAVVCSW